MSNYIESRQQPDGSWNTYITWDGNENPEKEIPVTEHIDKLAFGISPILFGCLKAKEEKVKLHNVIDKNSKKQYIKAEHSRECPSFKDALFK